MMNRELEEALNRLLRAEAKKSVKETDIEKLNDIYNIKKIIDEYDELGPILREYFRRKAERDKWSR